MAYLSCKNIRQYLDDTKDFIDLLIKKLGIRRKIIWHVEPGYKKALFGLSAISSNKADIYIYASKHFCKKEILLTCIHELIHVRICSLRLSKGSFGKSEESFVQGIENLIKLFI